jgi:hypothetical protein
MSSAANGASATKSILFVCLGNICRSPSVSCVVGQAAPPEGVCVSEPASCSPPHSPAQAEAVFKSVVEKKGQGKESCAIRGCCVSVCACPSCSSAAISAAISTHIHSLSCSLLTKNLPTQTTTNSLTPTLPRPPTYPSVAIPHRQLRHWRG